MKKNARWLALAVVVLIACSLLMPGSSAEPGKTTAKGSNDPIRGDVLFRSDSDLFKSDSKLLAGRLFASYEGLSPLAAGDITVKSGYALIAGNQTFTLVKEFFTSTDCTTGGSGQTQDAGVNSSTGVTFARPGGANSVKLIAPNQDPEDPIQRSDQNASWSQWTSPDGAVPPGEPSHNQRICVPYSAVPATRTFVARFNPGVQTFASDCTTPKTLFNVGDTVCARFFFDPAQTQGNLLKLWISSPPYDGGGCVRNCPSNDCNSATLNVTTDTGTKTYVLPATDTTVGACGGGNATVNRGNWTVTGVDQGNNTRTTTLIRVHNPAPGHEAVDLGAQKGPLSATVNCGSNITWRIFVTSQGPDDAQGVTIVDPLPKSTTFQSITAPGWSCSTPAVGATGNISCTRASLAAPALFASFIVSTIDVVAQVVNTGGLANNSQITNGAIVSSQTFELGKPDNSTANQLFSSLVTTAGCAAGGGPVITRSTGTTNPVVVTESCIAANSAVDPREQVTVSFCVQNFGTAATAGLMGILQETGGVTNSTSGAVQFGNGVVPTQGGGGLEKCATFSFKAANVSCGVQLIGSIDLFDNTHTNLGTVQFPIQTGTGGFGQPFVCCNAPTAAESSVSGTITDNAGTPVEGAVVRLSGTQNRKFITDANGFYRFDNVEISGFYTVTPSRVNYTFSPSSRSFSQLGETTEAAFGATLTSGGFVNPLDTPEYFVRQHYLDFLGREPDEAGFNFWSDQILECGNDNNCIERRRENVSAAYFLSIEFQQTAGLVDGLYRASYGIRPQFAEFMPDTRAVAGGVVVGRAGWEAKLEANKQAFVAAFVQRPAFIGTYGNVSNDRFVDMLISHTGASFTSGERDALVAGLTNNTMTRADVLRQIAENESFIAAKRNEAFVMMEYFGYLRRELDADGYQFWLNKLNEFNGNFEQAEMVKAFIVSGEYRARFSH